MLLACACGRLRFDPVAEDAPVDVVVDAACGAAICFDTIFAIDVASSNNATFGSHALAVQSDGKIVVAGVASTTPASRDAIVVRLLDDGTFDPAFGTGGVAFVDAGGDDSGICLTLDRSGRVVVGGATGSQGLVARLTSAGVLDTTFNGTGFVVPSFTGGTVMAVNGVRVDPQGNVVSGGQGLFTGMGAFNLTTARVTDVGVADATFDGDGLVVSDLFAADEFGALGALGPDDTIYTVGETFNGVLNFDGVLLRLLPTGTRDPAFGVGGVATLDIANGTQRFFGVAIDGARRAVTVGTTGDADLLLARFSTSGGLDDTFGAGGATVLDRGADERLRAVLMLPDGRIVAGGRSEGASIVLLLSSDGALIETYALGGGTREVSSLAIDQQGRVLALGEIDGAASTDIYVARLIIP